jgi:YD repeat-containing protein
MSTILPLAYFPFTAIAQDNIGRRDTNTVTDGFGLHPSYGYDLNGNLLSESSALTNNRAFPYDDENQLISVWVTDIWRDDFAYDGLPALWISSPADLGSVVKRLR